jgi:hypothetical protein
VWQAAAKRQLNILLVRLPKHLKQQQQQLGPLVQSSRVSDEAGQQELQQLQLLLARAPAARKHLQPARQQSLLIRLLLLRGAVQASRVARGPPAAAAAVAATLPARPYRLLSLT